MDKLSTDKTGDTLPTLIDNFGQLSIQQPVRLLKTPFNSRLQCIFPRLFYPLFHYLAHSLPLTGNEAEQGGDPRYGPAEGTQFFVGHIVPSVQGFLKTFDRIEIQHDVKNRPLFDLLSEKRDRFIGIRLIGRLDAEIVRDDQSRQEPVHFPPAEQGSLKCQTSKIVEGGLRMHHPIQ